MRTQLKITNTPVYTFETEDFEQWQLDSLEVVDEAEDADDEPLFADEALAGNVIEFLGEVSRH